MEILTSIADLEKFKSNPDHKNKVTGLVPTMGALHEGHLSLVATAYENSDLVIVSIFVNPTQFNDPNDLKNYPRDLDKDISMLSSQNKTHAIFAPEVKEIYPVPDTRQFDFGTLDKVMEGAHRPGHFNGVAQVVSKLFTLVKPRKAFFGQKDFQQLAVIRQLVKQMNSDIEIYSCPIVRESDGFAMSSRNQLLSAEERLHAANISGTLFKSKELKQSMDIKKFTSWVISEVNSDPLLRVEYFQVVDSSTLLPVTEWGQPCGKQGCIAVKVGKIRLIDNINFD